jgi:hypothetical protein
MSDSDIISQSLFRWCVSILMGWCYTVGQRGPYIASVAS